MESENRVTRLFFLATCQLKLGKLEEALSVCNSILQQDSKNPKALLLRSRVHRKRQQYEKSLVDL